MSEHDFQRFGWMRDMPTRVTCILDREVNWTRMLHRQWIVVLTSTST